MFLCVCETWKVFVAKQTLWSASGPLTSRCCSLSQLNVCVCFLSQITAVCREAALLALQEDIKARHIQARHFESALDAVKPRIPDSLIQSYISYQQRRSGFFWPRRKTPSGPLERQLLTFDANNPRSCWCSGCWINWTTSRDFCTACRCLMLNVRFYFFKATLKVFNASCCF